MALTRAIFVTKVFDRLRVGWLNGDLSGRGTTRAEDAQGTPTQIHISPSILVYEDKSIKLFPPRSAAADVSSEAGLRLPSHYPSSGH